LVEVPLFELYSSENFFSYPDVDSSSDELLLLEVQVEAEVTKENNESKTLSNTVEIIGDRKKNNSCSPKPQPEPKVQEEVNKDS